MYILASKRLNSLRRCKSCYIMFLCLRRYKLSNCAVQHIRLLLLSEHFLRTSQELIKPLKHRSKLLQPRCLSQYYSIYLGRVSTIYTICILMIFFLAHDISSGFFYQIAELRLYIANQLSCCTCQKFPQTAISCH